jgi:hypothetical protein
MMNMEIGIGVCALTFLLGYAGMWVQKLLPESHMTSGARDMIGAVMGLIALLLALVLGTLVGSAYGFYATQKANVETLAARAIQLDMALKTFGAEGAPLRAGLRGSVAQAYKAIWVDNLDPRDYKLGALVAGFGQLNDNIALLKPTTPAQTAAMPAINVSVGVLEQTRLLMSLQLASPISWPLLIVVVSWAMLLFAGYGVLARLNGTAVIAALIGAFAVGSAVFLILELNEPFIGFFRIPASAMQQTLAVLGS